MSGIRGLFLLEVSCCSEWVFEVIGREILSSETLFLGRLRQCSQNTRSRRCPRLSFRGRTAVPLHAFCPDVGPKWSRSRLRGDPLFSSKPRLNKAALRQTLSRARCQRYV